jgi:hypothetical protein
MDILLGGINVADRYNDMDHEPAWLDLAVSLNHPIAIDVKKLDEILDKTQPKPEEGVPPKEEDN